MKPIAIIYNEGVVSYDFGPGHPFRGTRFLDYIDLLKDSGILSLPDVHLIKSDAADDRDLQLVHSESYIEVVKYRANRYIPLSGDTPLSPAILKSAYLIVGSSLKAGEMVVENLAKVAQSVGGGLHHAGRNYGGGFCVFNDVAVLAKSLLDRKGLDRVLIFDSDVHSGNGTMDIFYEEPRVLFISVHQDPSTIYPGTGFIEEIGSGPGEGYTVNVPLPPGAGDKSMGVVLEEIFKPLVYEFKPQIIIRNGGSDPHFQDILGSLNITYAGLNLIGKAVSEAAKLVQCGVVDLPLSGYNPDTVAKGWLAIFSGIIGLSIDLNERVAPMVTPAGTINKTQNVVKNLKKLLKKYWNLS